MPTLPPSSNADTATSRHLMREVRLASALRALHGELSTLSPELSGAPRTTVARLLRDIDTVLAEHDAWDGFVDRFDGLHDNFLGQLAREFPSLTPTELRLCAFLRLPMPSKEIATFFHCSVRSVEKHRERLRKKFGLRSHENLTTFLTARQAGSVVDGTPMSPEHEAAA